MRLDFFSAQLPEVQSNSVIIKVSFAIDVMLIEPCLRLNSVFIPANFSVFFLQQLQAYTIPEDQISLLGFRYGVDGSMGPTLTQELTKGCEFLRFFFQAECKIHCSKVA